MRRAHQPDASTLSRHQRRTVRHRLMLELRLLCLAHHGVLGVGTKLETQCPQNSISAATKLGGRLFEGLGRYSTLYRHASPPTQGHPEENTCTASQPAGSVATVLCRPPRHDAWITRTCSDFSRLRSEIWESKAGGEDAGLDSLPSKGRR